MRVWMATDGSRRYGVIKKVSANGQIASDALSVIIVLDTGTDVAATTTARRGSTWNLLPAADNGTP